MSDPRQKLTPEQVTAADLDGWRLHDETIQARYATSDFATGLKLVNAIGEAAEAANHHPDIVLTYPSVQVTLSSHDVDGLTSRDLDLARCINELAADLGVHAD